MAVMGPEPFFLLADVPGDIFMLVVGGMGVAVSGLAVYVTKLHAQNRADLVASVSAIARIEETMRDMTRARDERTQHISTGSG